MRGVRRCGYSIDGGVISVLVVLLVTSTPVPATAQVDTAAVRARASDEVATFERVLRRSYAPFLLPWKPPALHRPCDEMVGEFCVRYGYQLDHPNMSFAEIDPPTLVRLREQTISTLSELVVDLPHDTLVSPPLVRLLVDGWRTSEAVEAALAFTVADTTDAWSYTLLGFALRADRQTLAAERAFEAAFARLAAEEREELADVRPLLAGEEQPTYDELVGSGREAYRAALWRAADPLYLTPGNEVRTEHLWTCPGSVDG